MINLGGFEVDISHNSSTMVLTEAIVSAYLPLLEELLLAEMIVEQRQGECELSRD
jgi:hypothetical protein